MKILILEDDDIQASQIAEEVLWKADPKAEIRYFDSEYSFMEALEAGNLQAWQPNFALVDLRMRYYSTQDLEKPNVKPDFSNLPDYNEAGIRCCQKLSQRCPGIRYALMSVNDFPKNCRFPTMNKGSHQFAEDLTRVVKAQ